MARKTKKNSPNADATQGEFFCASDAKWGGFINIKFDDDQKNDFKDWFNAWPDEVSRIVDEFLAEGGKLSYAYDRANQCYIVTFTGKLVSSHEDRYAASSRSGTLQEALAIMAYKHAYIAEGDYGNYRPATGYMENWG